MALWVWTSPVREQRSLEEKPIFSIWTRVKRDIPSTIILNAANVWEEWIGTWPQLESPSNTFYFGAKGFNDMGTDQSAFAGCNRLYLGGHNYIIDDTLKAELVAAVVQPYAPTGYGAFITAAPANAVYTGDEILLSGRTSEFAQGHGVRS